MIKNGVFLARMQPLHKGHLFMVENALTKCEKLTIVLGSMNKFSMTRNPFTFELRKLWLLEALKVSKDMDRINMFELPDWSLENDKNETIEWGRYFYYNVVSRIQAKKFSIFYNDDLDIINSWFDETLRSRIDIQYMERSSIFDGLSATRIRKAIVEDDNEYLKKYLPFSVLKDVVLLKKYLLQVNEHPLQDFSME